MCQRTALNLERAVPPFSIQCSEVLDLGRSGVRVLEDDLHQDKACTVGSNTS
jgi:hypothetical protein